MNNKNEVFLNSKILVHPSKKLSRLIAKELKIEDPAEGLTLIEDLFNDKKEIRVHRETDSPDNSKDI